MKSSGLILAVIFFLLVAAIVYSIERYIATCDTTETKPVSCTLSEMIP